MAMNAVCHLFLLGSVMVFGALRSVSMRFKFVVSMVIDMVNSQVSTTELTQQISKGKV